MTITNVSPLTDLGGFILCIVFAVVIITLLGGALSSRRTQQYRKYLADLWVAAKIKFLANEDNLDLEAEADAFKEWSKKSRVRNSEHDLDKTVEADLKERVIEPVKKKK